MIIIADTTRLNHLLLIERAAILQDLYGRVIVPAGVLAEGTAPSQGLRLLAPEAGDPPPPADTAGSKIALRGLLTRRKPRGATQP